MERFFFDTNDSGSVARDDEGMDLADRDAARQQALNALPDIARDVLPRDGDRRDMIVDVRDASGRMVFTASLSLVARWVD